MNTPILIIQNTKSKQHNRPHQRHHTSNYSCQYICIDNCKYNGIVYCKDCGIAVGIEGEINAERYATIVRNEH